MKTLWERPEAGVAVSCKKKKKRAAIMEEGAEFQLKSKSRGKEQNIHKLPEDVE